MCRALDSYLLIFVLIIKIPFVCDLIARTARERNKKRKIRETERKVENKNRESTG